MVGVLCLDTHACTRVLMRASVCVSDLLPPPAPDRLLTRRVLGPGGCEVFCRGQRGQAHPDPEATDSNHPRNQQQSRRDKEYEHESSWLTPPD